jgi:RimJ/RimL family protein N-acetyltransferase
MIELETKRLYLREMLPEDAQDMFELNSDIEVTQYTGDTPFRSVKDALNLLTNYDQYNKFSTGRFSVFNKETSQYIGFCGLKTLEDGTVDLGFRFHKRFWGKGYGKESSLIVLNYAFQTLKLKEIYGNFMPENIASKKLLESLGFEPYGKSEEWVVYLLRNPLNN